MVYFCSITDLCDFTTGMIGALFAAKMLHIQITVDFMFEFIVSIINGVYVFTAILFSVSCISFWTMKSKCLFSIQLGKTEEDRDTTPATILLPLEL